MKQKIKEFYHEEAREIPVIAEADVLVCGGGPAGVGAAITAARQGVKTMVIEKEDCLGGIRNEYCGIYLIEIRYLLYC